MLFRSLNYSTNGGKRQVKKSRSGFVIYIIILWSMHFRVGRGISAPPFRCLFAAAHGWPPYGGCGADSPKVGNEIGAFCRDVEDAVPYEGSAQPFRRRRAGPVPRLSDFASGKRRAQATRPTAKDSRLRICRRPAIRSARPAGTSRTPSPTREVRSRSDDVGRGLCPACRILLPVSGGRKRPALRQRTADCGFAGDRQ